MRAHSAERVTGALPARVGSRYSAIHRKLSSDFAEPPGPGAGSLAQAPSSRRRGRQGFAPALAHHSAASAVSFSPNKSIRPTRSRRKFSVRFKTYRVLPQPMRRLYADSGQARRPAPTPYQLPKCEDTSTCGVRRPWPISSLRSVKYSKLRFPHLNV